jgi:hypothetical protein
MGFWSKLLKEKAKDWLYVELPSGPGSGEQKAVIPQSEYVTITLKSMRIVDVRVAFTTFYGAIQSFITLDHMNGKPVEFNIVTTPPKLKELDPKNLDLIITRDTPLLGPIPYAGGKLEMEIGLFAIKSDNLAEPFLSVLSEMSDLAGVSFIKAAVPYLGPIKTGIDALISANGNGSALLIGLSATYQQVKTGYYVVARIERDQVDPDKLTIDKDFRLLDENGKPIRDVPYIVFQVSSSPKRNDWFMIPELVEAHQALKAAVKSIDKTKIREALMAFKTVVLTSSDLVLKDAKEIYKQVYDDAMNVIKELEDPLPFGDEPLKGAAKKAAAKKTASNKASAKKAAPKPSLRRRPVKLKELKSLKIYQKK